MSKLVLRLILLQVAFGGPPTLDAEERHGMELPRLLTEPRRLATRYASNASFVFRMIIRDLSDLFQRA